MAKFREFLKNHWRSSGIVESFQSEQDKELQNIWSDVFKALGVGGLSDEDAAQQSLSKITFGQRTPGQGNQSTFKGKQAVQKRLENGQIFQRLEKIPDPELRKGVEDARRWLGSPNSGPESANASTTVSTLLQKLFGQKYYQRFIDSDMPRVDQAKAQVQPQAPKPNMEPSPDHSMSPTTPQPQPGPPMGGQMGQQPQAPGVMMPPQPNNPMPVKPAGAELGMY